MLLVSLSAREEGGGGEERKREKGRVRREEGEERSAVPLSTPPLAWCCHYGWRCVPSPPFSGGAICFLKTEIKLNNRKSSH